MRDLLRVTVVECQHDLAENAACLFLREKALLDDFVEEFATGAEPVSTTELLGHHIDVSGILECLEQLNDVGVVQLLENFDLVGEFLGVLDFTLWDLLDCAPGVVTVHALYSALQHGAECASSKGLRQPRCTVL